jgi:hypothetical protein
MVPTSWTIADGWMGEELLGLLLFREEQAMNTEFDAIRDSRLSTLQGSFIRISRAARARLKAR